MSLFTDSLPDSVTAGGLSLPIETNFRVSIRYEVMMTDPRVPDPEKLLQSLLLFFPNHQNVVSELFSDGHGAELVNQIAWFYNCGKENASPAKTQNKPVYSFEADDGYIYAAFHEQYRIDLTEIPYLHWWKFRSLFLALKECELIHIMGYRSANLKDYPKKQRSAMRKLQRQYQLPDYRTEEQKELDFSNSLSCLF